VPESPTLAETFAGMHWLFTRVLGVAILLHVAGALKHIFVDRDGVFARMWRGTPAGRESAVHSGTPLAAAAIIWALSLVGGIWIGRDAAANLSRDPVAWTITEERVQLLDPGGTVLGEIPASDLSISLAITPEGQVSGTLGLFAALDSFDGAGADPLFQNLVVPIAQFNGPISGRLPEAAADGTFDVGGQIGEAIFAVAIDADRAEVSGSAPIPGAPDFALSISATATKP
jgi:hypothetical protein